MQELLRSLTEKYAPSGFEKSLREDIRARIKPFVDEMRVDALGNLIAIKKGTSGKGKRIMLAAHMDEIGLIASHIDDNGFIRFTSLGTPFAKYLPGGRVRFLNGIEGVIGTERMEPIHETPPLEKMYIDIGAISRKDSAIEIGSVAAFTRSFERLGNRLVAKSMDDRAGVVVLIEILRTLRTTPHEIYFVFTAQEEVGTRGSGPATFGIEPEIGIAVDVTPAEDTPNHPRATIRLGNGPAIKIRDPHMISDPKIVAWMIKTANHAHIPFQREVLLAGGTDARAMQISGKGVAAGAISIPCRYVHSPSEMIDYEDLKNTAKLLKALLSRSVEL